MPSQIHPIISMGECNESKTLLRVVMSTKVEKERAREYGAIRLAQHPDEMKVGGSNPPTPTMTKYNLQFQYEGSGKDLDRWLAQVLMIDVGIDDPIITVKEDDDDVAV